MVFGIEATSCPLSSNLLSAELRQRIFNGFAQAANQHQEVLNLDQRAPNAFLVSMPWHTFMESMDRVALHQLMSIPDHDESYANKISDHTKEYFDIYMNKISEQSYLIQR
jgi:hypothetical protein